MGEPRPSCGRLCPSIAHLTDRGRQFKSLQDSRNMADRRAPEPQYVPLCFADTLHGTSPPAIPKQPMNRGQPFLAQGLQVHQWDRRILRCFTGTHPQAIKDWLVPSEGVFETDPALSFVTESSLCRCRSFVVVVQKWSTIARVELMGCRGEGPVAQRFGSLRDLFSYTRPWLAA
jgi:hypothetical protein